MKSPNEKIVLVEWVDSCTHQGWNAPSDISHTAKTCFTVGCVVRETRQIIVLAGSCAMDDDDHFDQVTGTITIPQSCIVRSKTLFTRRL